MRNTFTSSDSVTPGAWFADSASSLVKVTAVTENRVIYLRYGYSAPCICSPGRLLREFKPAAAPDSMGEVS